MRQFYLIIYRNALILGTGVGKEAISANNPRFHFRATRATTVAFPPLFGSEIAHLIACGDRVFKSLFLAISVASVEQKCDRLFTVCGELVLSRDPKISQRVSGLNGLPTSRGLEFSKVLNLLYY